MEWIVPVVFLVLASSSLQDTPKLYGPMEYCIMDVMNITCKGESVIMMETAVYGIMDVGRCVKNYFVNIDTIDCANDVIAVLDATCSGQHTCSLRIPEEKMHKVYKENPNCPQELAAYLEVTYKCLDVVRGDRKHCPESRSVKVTGSQGFISSVVASPFMAGGSRIIGSSSCPWYITVDPTQTIKITLYNFQYGLADQQLKPGNLQSVGHDGCFDAATMRDNGRHRVLKVCHDTRTKVYTSSTNRIYLDVASHRNVLIKYEAEGCPQLKVQEHAWITKDPDGTLRIRCNHTDETWFLTCKDSTWLGEIGNCSLPHRSWGLIDLFGMGNKFPYGVLIVIGIGVILGVVIGGLLLMCVVAYSKRFAVPKPSNEQQAPEGQDASVGVWENKAVTNRYASSNSSNQPPLPPPPPPPLPPPLPDSYRTRPLPPPTTGPPAVPSCGRSPSQQHRNTDSLLRCSAPSGETSTHYGSAAVTTFTTFGRRQHLYECPEFT